MSVLDELRDTAGKLFTRSEWRTISTALCIYGQDGENGHPWTDKEAEEIHKKVTTLVRILEK
jgi:hypothetical protein